MLFHLLQIISIILLIALFTCSYIGFGVFFNNIIFKHKATLNLGHLGLLGIFFLITLSYLTSLFVPHNSFHNILVLLTGILFFLYNRNRFKKSEIKTILYIIFLPASLLSDSANCCPLPLFPAMNSNSTSFPITTLENCPAWFSIS